MDTDEIRPRSATTEKEPAPLAQPPTALMSGSLHVVHSPDAASVGRSLPLDEDMLAIGRDVDDPGILSDIDDQQDYQRLIKGQP